MRPVTSKRILSAALLLAVTGCSFGTDFERYREVIRKRLRDPESATFRDESIRTLWSKEGSRKTIYCAMVNSNNAYGGKTGFGPATVIIDTQFTDAYRKSLIKGVVYPGKSFIDPEMHPNHYLDCIRSDTQRSDEDVFSIYPTYGRKWDETFKEQVDREIPVLSNDEAPKS